jgi:hypothetical protein
MYKSVAILALTVGLAGIPNKAIACSWVAPPLTGYVQRSQVIVVGTVEKSTDAVATVRVESYLKGDRPESTLQVDNYLYDTGGSCSPLLPMLGYRFVENDQVLLFLDADPQKTDLWHPVGVNDEAAFPISQGKLLPGMLNLQLMHNPEHLQHLDPPDSYRRIESQPLQSLVEAKRAISEVNTALNSTQFTSTLFPRERGPLSYGQDPPLAVVAKNFAILGPRIIARSRQILLPIP